MQIERGRTYKTLDDQEFNLDDLDQIELDFLRHLERRSMLESVRYASYMQGVTQWDHPAYKGRKPAEIATCSVYQIAEDLGLRLGIRLGELSDEDPECSDEELIDMMVPDGIVGKAMKHRAKRNARKERKARDKRGPGQDRETDQ